MKMHLSLNFRGFSHLILVVLPRWFCVSFVVLFIFFKHNYFLLYSVRSAACVFYYTYKKIEVLGL